MAAVTSQAPAKQKFGAALRIFVEWGVLIWLGTALVFHPAGRQRFFGTRQRYWAQFFMAEIHMVYHHHLCLNLRIQHQVPFFACDRVLKSSQVILPSPLRSKPVDGAEVGTTNFSVGITVGSGVNVVADNGVFVAIGLGVIEGIIVFWHSHIL